MAKNHNNAVTRDAKKLYKTFAEQKVKTYLTENEIQRKHLEAEKKALEYFEKQQMGDPGSNPAILKELKQVCFI